MYVLPFREQPSLRPRIGAPVAWTRMVRRGDRPRITGKSHRASMPFLWAPPHRRPLDRVCTAATHSLFFQRRAPQRSCANSLLNLFYFDSKSKSVSMRSTSFSIRYRVTRMQPDAPTTYLYFLSSLFNSSMSTVIGYRVFFGSTPVDDGFC